MLCWETCILIPMEKTDNSFLNYSKRYSSIKSNLEEQDYIDIDDFYL